LISKGQRRDGAGLDGRCRKAALPAVDRAPSG
jgi:hypothetical protein